jgi:hypothetical protein
MSAPINEIIKRRVIQLWLSGESRDKIGSVQGSDIDSLRELAVEAKKQGLSVSDQAQHIRLRNFFIKSGASEEKIESFITNVSSNDVPSKESLNFKVY